MSEVSTPSTIFNAEFPHVSARHYYPDLCSLDPGLARLKKNASGLVVMICRLQSQCSTNVPFSASTLLEGHLACRKICVNGLSLLLLNVGRHTRLGGGAVGANHTSRY